MNIDFEIRAYAFARQAHEGQVRKYTGDPYILHPISVASIVSKVPHTKEMIAAAFLHDVVEDTDTTLDDIRKCFGDQVAMLVESLTNLSRPEDGNRTERKRIDREHLAKASPQAMTIKLADLINNAQSISIHDPKFARSYLAEMRLLLDVLTAGNESLWHRAKQLTL